MRTKLIFAAAAIFFTAAAGVRGQESVPAQTIAISGQQSGAEVRSEADPSRPGKWTLTECIDYALNENIQVRKSEVSVSVGEISLQQAKDNRWPGVSASLGESVGWRQVTGTSGESSFEGSARTSASVSSSVTLFSGFQAQNEIRQAELNYKSLQYSTDETRERVSLNIMSAYLQVLYAEEQVANSRNQVESTSEQLVLAQERLGLGAIANSDYLQVKTQLASEELTLANAVNNLKMAKVTLMQLMEYPVDGSFEIARPDIDAIISTVPASDAITVYEEALQIKPQIKNAEINLESALVSLELAKGGFYPSVSMNAGLSSGFTGAAEMGSQLKSGFSPSVGLSVSIPVFRNNQVKSSVARSRYGITTAGLDELNTKNQLRKEVEQAVLDAQSASISYEAALNQHAASAESYSVAEEKYRLGAMNSVDFLIQKTNLTTAESRLLQAKYELVYSCKIIDFYRGVPLSF